MSRLIPIALAVLILSLPSAPRRGSAADPPAGAPGLPAWGTGAIVVVVERESGSVLVIDSSRHVLLGRVEGLGDLVHATVKFGRDGRHAYVIARDGVVSKVDLYTLRVARQVKAAGWSIGGTMTVDGRHLALSNYGPGEVRLLDAETLATVKVIPAERLLPDGTRPRSRVVGLVDAPGNLLLFSLMDRDGVWVVDAGKPDFPVIRQYWDAGVTPYDALVTPDGRYYVVGFLGSNWMGVVDTWRLDGVRPILAEQGGGDGVPLWKIPHLKGWALAGSLAFLPALKREVVLVYDTRQWTARPPIPISGTALYTVVRPDRRHVWVDIVGKNGDLIDVIDVETLGVVRTLDAGPGATHPQFTPKGEAAYVSLMDGGKVVVYDTGTFERIAEFPARQPSGIFFADRAHKYGM